jgi:hypothetical protein
MTHHGLLSSVEFSKAPAVPLGNTVAVVKVVKGGRASPLAAVADRAEHGE